MTHRASEESDRDVYVVRVNMHNAQWNGTVCEDPVRHGDCRARDSFKSEHCARGLAHCFFISLFAQSGCQLRLPGSQQPYADVFEEQWPRPDDLMVFWATWATENRNYPVGMWRVVEFEHDSFSGWRIKGPEIQDACLFPPKACGWRSLETRVSLSVGADMVRLLPAGRLHGLATEWIANLNDAMEAAEVRREGVDDYVAARSYLEEVAATAPESFGTGLTQRLKLPAGIVTTPEPRQPVAHPKADSTHPEAPTPAPAEVPAPVPAIHMGGELALFQPSVVTDYKLALAAAQLLVIAGPSGVGKTRLTAEMAKETKAEYMLVSVRPDWRTNEDMLGWRPPYGGPFIPTPFSLFVKEAADEWYQAQAEGRSAKPFHLCLDEMNLARPEYYMAEVLSKMELPLGERTLRLYEADEDHGFPRTLELPPNLRIVCTVNNDDTTYPLSPKVVDRAVYVTIPDADLRTWLKTAHGLEQELRTMITELDGILKQGRGYGLGYRTAAQLIAWIGQADAQGMDGAAAIDSAIRVLVLTSLRLDRANPAHRSMLAALRAFFDENGGEDVLTRCCETLEALEAELDVTDFAYGQFAT